MPRNTAFIVTNVTNDHDQSGSHSPSMPKLAQAVRQAAKVAIRARETGRIYAESIGLGSREHWGGAAHEFWNQDQEQTSEPEKAPLEVIQNCWTTPAGLIKAARGTHGTRPDFLITSQKVLKGAARTYITTLEGNLERITIQVEFK